MWPLSLTLECLCTIICLTETCRFLALHLTVVQYWLEMEVTCLELIQRIPSSNGDNDHLFFKWYSAHQIADQSFWAPLCTLVAILMGDGFAVFVVCNVGTVKGFSILPLEVYWILPLVSLISTFFTSFLLPFGIETWVKSKQIINWRRNGNMVFDALQRKAKEKQEKIVSRRCIGWSSKILRRKYVAIRPIGLSCGSFFPLKRGAESTYFYWIVWQTADRVLLPFSP